MITNPSHTLIFGGITMVEDGANPPDASGVRYDVMSQDTDWGNPAPVTVALLSLMRAGSAVAYDRTENREPVLRVTIKADDSDLLAQGEKALQLECEKPNTLTWIPPDGAGERSVFDVVWSSLELVFDDVQELLRQRVYLVRLQALPYARGEDLVVTPAQPSATETVIDTGSSTTGWATSIDTKTGQTVALSVVSGKVTSTVTGAGNGTVLLTRTGTIDVSTQKVIAIDLVASVAIGLPIVSTNGPNGPGVAVLQLASQASLGGGVTRYFYVVPTSTVTISSLWVYAQGTYATSSTVAIDQVARWTALPFFGTARQKALSIVPGGSVRTQGSIAVAHASNALGKTIVYTHPSGTGYHPPLRPWRVSSEAVTADATLLSGSRNATGPASTIYRLPVSALPEGRAELWAWIRETVSAGTKSLSWAVDSYMGSTSLGYTLETIQVSLPILNQWYLVPISAMTLPLYQMGPAGFVEVHLNGGSNIQIDEAYLFATDEGRLTVVECGAAAPTSGGTSNRLWVDAPSLDQPMGGVYRGNAADRSDAWHAGALAEPWQMHDFEPAGTNVFVATQNTVDAETSLTHYKRFHTHVARDL